MADVQTTQFDRECLEALKSIGKTLGQMTLYKVGHPAVAATLQIAETQLAAAMGQTQQGELSFSLDQEKLIANGRIVGAIGQVPNAVALLFNRFKLSSLTFKSGLANAELVAFCELAASRQDSPAAADPPAYLAERGVTHIILNEAVYSKQGETPPPAAPPADASIEEAAAEVERAIEAAMEQQSVERTIMALIEKAVPDPALRKKIFEKVMEMLKKDIEKRVEEAVKPVRAEKNIIANEQVRTQTVLQSTVEGVVIVDDKGKILMMNPAAEQIYGTTLAQAAGKHLTEHAKEEHVVTLAAELATPPPEGPVNKDVRVAGNADTRRTVQKAGAIVQNEAGKVVGMVSTLTDVAKHKELQRMQRDFIAHVTHELRSPLSSIRAALEILQGEVSARIGEKENRMLTTAISNSDRLAGLINQILDFSKIESGQMTVFPKKADAEGIGREAIDSLAPWAQKKGLTLSLLSDPQIPPVKADAPRTVQVLINLLSNAIKFTPAGGRITVKIVPSAQDADRVVLFLVTDTGPGIPKSEQKRVFEKFAQIAAGETHVGGTGLGLSIAKAFVHLQGGKMWLESEEGQGATFYFTVPLYVGAKDEAAATPEPAAQPLPWWKRLLGLKK